MPAAGLPGGARGIRGGHAGGLGERRAGDHPVRHRPDLTGRPGRPLEERGNAEPYLRRVFDRPHHERDALLLSRSARDHAQYGAIPGLRRLFLRAENGGVMRYGNRKHRIGSASGESHV